jgi:hypothetical protein
MIGMKAMPNKITKSQLRKELHLTRPPRLEGAVKEAGMRKVMKPKAPRKASAGARKVQGYTEQQRKDYQLKSKRRG